MEEHLKKYKLLGLNIYQMEEVKEGFRNGLTIEQVEYYAKPKFDHLQMEEIRKAFQDGFTYEQVDTFGKVEFNYEAMNHARIKLKNSNLIDEKAQEDLNRKRIKNLILIVLFFSLLGVGIFMFILAKTEYKLYFQKLELVLTDKKVTIGYKEPFIAMNYVEYYTEDNNVEIILPEEVHTDILGEQKIVYKIKNSKRVVTKILEIDVIDNKEPLLELNTYRDEIIKDKDNFNCKTYIKHAVDEVDGDILEKVTCNNDIHLGENIIIYEVSDNSGNVKNVSLELLVKEEIKKEPIKQVPKAYQDKKEENIPNVNENINNYTEVTQKEDSGWIYEKVEIDDSGNTVVTWED